MATFGTGGGVLTFQYWNGTAWVTLPNIVDGTANFTKNGKLTFDIPNDWALHTPSQDTAWGRSTTAALPPNNGLNSNGTAQYWIRIGCSTAFTNTPYIQYITPSPFPGYLAFYSNGGFNRFYIDSFGNGYFAGNLIVDGQLQWNNVSYVNTYSDWGNGFAPTSYVRNGSMVRLRGIVKTNSFGVGNAMFGLPSGYRPANSKFFICLGYSSVYGYGLVGVQVDPNGNVTQQSALWNGNTTASAQWCSLEQISFPVNS